MSLLEHELAKLTSAVLRGIVARGVPETAAAAQAELDARPAEPVDDTEAWIRRTFPQRPNPFA